MKNLIKDDEEYQVFDENYYEFAVDNWVKEWKGNKMDCWSYYNLDYIVGNYEHEW